MIKLININKYYSSDSSKFHALKNISLDLKDKGMIYIVGKSGSGKSTLLNIIGGIDKYDSGELIITESYYNDGKLVKETLNTKNFTKKDYNNYRNSYVGFIFQEFNVIKGLTVYENIALSLELQHKNIKQYHNKIKEIINKVGLAGKEKRRINQLSGGEKQRVAIARAIIKDPRIIIADEPTGNLDAKNRDIVMNILKDLSKDKLVLIVTHDKELASLYGDRKITIKDGEIVSDDLINQNNFDKVYDSSGLKRINPSSFVSFKLAIKSLILNKFRFILVILLFAISLVFAGSVINLNLADTTKEYANYQNDYGNISVSINSKYTYYDKNTSTGFYSYELPTIKKYFTEDDSDILVFTSMKTSIPLNMKYDNSSLDNPNSFYLSTIDTINLFEDINLLKSAFNYTSNSNEHEIINNSDYYCYITDYLYWSLCVNNYYGFNTLVDQKRIIGNTISIPGIKNKIVISGIIETNFMDFYEAYSSNYEGLNDEEKNKFIATFTDNLAIYNAIYMSNTVYRKLFNSVNNTTNIDYIKEDIYYLGNDSKAFSFNDIKISYYKDSDTILLGSKPTLPLPEEITKVAVSKGFLNKVIGIELSEVEFDNKTPKNLSLENKLTSSFNICGKSRIPYTLQFTISGIIDSEEIIIYTPSLDESPLFNNIISSSFIEGGFVTALISNDKEVNSKVYRKLLTNKIEINNESFKKLQIVDNFIQDNLFLFFAIFFAFCMFSILMIFNFIIINIKNSTRDIGIYMSLGMSGFKIALIYIFQVLIISTIALIIGCIGSLIFINKIDSSFKQYVLIDFKVLKNTLDASLALVAIAYLSPLIAIISPLINLSNKKPIDVIKVS